MTQSDAESRQAILAVDGRCTTGAVRYTSQGEVERTIRGLPENLVRLA